MNRLIILLQRLLNWLTRVDQENRIIARHAAVEEFLHTVLPLKHPQYASQLIIKGGVFNYFVLPNDQLPRFDFALPEVPLFVTILSPYNSSWEVAEKYGVGRKSWETAMEQRGATREGVLEMPMAERPIEPLFWELDWNTPVDQSSLYNDFRAQTARLHK